MYSLVIFPFFKDTHGYTIMFAHTFYFFFWHGTLLLHPLLKPSGIIAEKYRSFFYWSCHNCFPFFWLQGQRYAQFLVAQRNAVESFSFSNMSKNASLSQSSLFGRDCGSYLLYRIIFLLSIFLRYPRQCRHLSNR